MSNAFGSPSLRNISQRRMWPLALALLGSQFIMQPCAYGADETLKGRLQRFSDRMSALATQLDQSAAIADRASRIVDNQRGTALNPATPSIRSSGDRASESNMVQLQQLVSERSQAIQLAASLSENLTEQARAVATNMRDGGATAAGKVAKPGLDSASTRGPARHQLIGVVTDLAKLDVKHEREAGNAALEAVKQAARSEALAAWKGASAARIAGVVPQPTIDIMQGAGSINDFSSISLEDALTLALLLAEADARADLQKLLKGAQDAHDRAYHAASKATFAIQFATLHLALAAAERRLTTRQAAPLPDFAFVRHMLYLIENPDRPTIDEERKKLQRDLKALQKQIRDLQAQWEDVTSRISNFEENCAKAILEAGKAAAAASVGSTIGGFLGGPLGAAIGGVVGTAVSGGSPQDVSNIAVCMELKALKEELARIAKQLAELGAKMKQMQAEIERKRKEIEASTRAIQRPADKAAVKPGAARLKPDDSSKQFERDGGAARKKTVASDKAVRPPCGTPDYPCSAAGRRKMPAAGGGSAMDRLSGGAPSGMRIGATSAGNAARPRVPSSAARAASGPAGGSVAPALTINRGAIGGAPERLR